MKVKLDLRGFEPLTFTRFFINVPPFRKGGLRGILASGLNLLPE